MILDPRENAGRPGGSAMVCGIIGQPVGHSLSPWMHRLFAEESGLDFLYAPFPVPENRLEEALCGLQALGIRGINVTVPYKEAVLPFLADCSPTATAIGAVNTLIFSETGIFGDNTDATGFFRAINRHAGTGWHGQPALVIGAGGASRAIVHALASGNAAPIYLANRSAERATILARDFPHLPIRPIPLTTRDLTPVLRQTVLVVNASSRGLKGEGHPELDLGLLSESGIVCDIVYRPLETPLLAAARANGRIAVDGLGMLVEQGAESFRLWTGVSPDTALVEDRLRLWLSTQKTTL